MPQLAGGNNRAGDGSHGAAELRRRDEIEPLGQVLALAEDTDRALINAHHRVEHVVEEVLHGVVFVQQVVLAQIGQAAGHLHQPPRPWPNTHQKHVAAAVAVGTHQAFQHVDAAKIDLVNMVHADEQKALAGVPGGNVENLLLDVVDCPEVEVALNLDDAKLWTDGGVRSVGKVAEVAVGHDHLNPRRAGAHDVKHE